MKAGKYARIERERRFHLLKLPGRITDASPYHLITDRYWQGSRLRLRLIQDVAGHTVARKLTQKEIVANLSADETVITNIYLNEAEYALLRPLPARLLEKKRYQFPVDGRHCSIDVFQGLLNGLYLAEIEDRFDGASWPPPQPSFARCDVTHDPLFRGGHLVNLSAAEFNVWKASWITQS